MIIRILKEQIFEIVIYINILQCIARSSSKFINYYISWVKHKYFNMSATIIMFYENICLLLVIVTGAVNTVVVCCLFIKELSGKFQLEVVRNKHVVFSYLSLCTQRKVYKNSR